MPSGPSEPAAFCSQVCSVLESLEQEYKREEDWCGGADKLGPNSETDHVTPMISKHLEQKEAFLKVRSGLRGAAVSLHRAHRHEGARLDSQRTTRVPMCWVCRPPSLSRGSPCVQSAVWLVLNTERD